MTLKGFPLPTNNQSGLESGIRDNYTRGRVGDFLREKIQSGSELSIVSAYFTIYAYEALKDELDQIAHLRFLFGEPRFVKEVDPDKSSQKAYKIEDDGLHLLRRLEQRRVARECAEWILKKVEIKSIKQSNLLHGKLYHMAKGGVEEAIMGSSNFTVNGLGLSEVHSNFELNLIVDSTRDRNDLKNWFNDLWQNDELVKDVKTEVLEYLDQLYRDNAPEFIYFKTLYEIFREYINQQDQGGLADIHQQVIDTEIWQALFEFQKDGVKGAINKIQNYNGCILADSVGLGKTYEALAVIKYFELKNQRVLVLCPKKLRENWTVYQASNANELNPFIKDRFSYAVLSHTDLSREGGYSGDIDLANVSWGNFDLVVIDESHNFRNNTPGKRDEDGNVIRRSRYERLMQDIIQSGVKTKVLLLSATPVNNTLKDLRNQIYFITGSEHEGMDTSLKESLGVESIQETLRVGQLTFNEWAKKNKDRNTAELLDKLSSAFFKLLDGLTIARSRKHVQKYYKDSVVLLGGFPEREKPISVYPNIDTRAEFMSYDKLNDEIIQYQLSLFKPSFYLLDEYKATYAPRVAAFTQENREKFLIGMMKVNFLKRLESSIHSFELTLSRTISKIDLLIDKIERFKQYQKENPDFDWDELQVVDPDDEELQQALDFQVSKAGIKLAHIRLDDWLTDLRKDREKLGKLHEQAKRITRERDAKLEELKKLIVEKVSHPTTNKKDKPNRKVLVFTAFADTAVYLYDSLMEWANEDLGINVALVSGGSTENKTTFGRNEFNQILTNFSPVSKNRAKIKNMPQDGEIDLLIATDCISEGQNLQDCDYLVNYDIHWNPVRVIQRFGRIDRIGSINKSVQLVNFWPTSDLDKYIALKTRVEARMALVDIAATQDDNLLNTEELENLITDELRYRDRQLKRLRDEVLDLEEFNESATLTDFTLDDFRAELTKFIEANRQKLEEAPDGLYAVVPARVENNVRPGVVYCLRQKGNAASTEVNPLQPYYLVYIQNEGVTRFGFTHPKQILTIFRELCSGNDAPFENLCREFDKGTQNGTKMQVYNDLLEKTVQSIENSFRKRVTSSLLMGRGAVIPESDEQVNDKTDFELVTWLVIR